MDRTGVAGVAKEKGTLDHIVLDDLYIHDVHGNVYNKHMTNGGIYLSLRSRRMKAKQELQDTMMWRSGTAIWTQ